MKDTIYEVSSMCFELKWRRLNNFPVAGLATIQEQKWRFIGEKWCKEMRKQWVDYFGYDTTQPQFLTTGYSMSLQ